MRTVILSGILEIEELGEPLKWAFCKFLNPEFPDCKNGA